MLGAAAGRDGDRVPYGGRTGGGTLPAIHYDIQFRFSYQLQEWQLRYADAVTESPRRGGGQDFIIILVTFSSGFCLIIQL